MSIYDGLASVVSPALQSVAACTLVVLLLAWYVRRDLVRNPDLIPDGRLSVRSFVELLFEGIATLARDTIGPEWARYMPLVCTLGLFILVSNLMGLIPGLGGATSHLETNLAWAVIAVILAEIVAIRHHGVVGWLKHFNPGPTWIAPLLFPVEVLSHLIRMFSLTVRLTANMFADHTLLAIFLSFGVVSYIVPWALLGLGAFIAFVQAFIFTFLAMVYIGLALEEAH